MSPRIERRDRASLADHVAKKIRARLQSKQLRVGDVFMTEAQLASEYAVSRTIVREAVGRLRALGLLEGRQGKGLVVRRPNLVRILSESMPSLSGSKKDFKELAQLRYALEVGGIDLAVANATETQIEQLRQCADEFAQAVRTGKDATQKTTLDLQFHTLLLEMTNSSFISGLHEVLTRFFEMNIARNTTNLAPADTTIMHHDELVSAIRDRDPERARYQISTHIHCYLENDFCEDEELVE